MGVEKHPLSPCFAHHVLPQDLWEERALLACFCFSSQAPSANIAASLICEETPFPHHRLHTLLSFPPQCIRLCSKPVIAHCRAPWRMDGFHMPLTPLPPSPHSPRLTLVCSLLSSFISPLSDMVPMEIQGTSGALPPQPERGV